MGDDPSLLPTAPPPRLAARRAAIEAALRKFDGVEDAAPAPAGRRQSGLFGWASMHRGPASALATAAVVAVVGIPIALATLKDIPRPPTQETAAPSSTLPVDTSSAEGTVAGLEPPEKAATEVAVADQPAPKQPLSPAEEARSRPAPMALTADAQKDMNDAPAPAAPAMAPAPPPPPPPAPAPLRSEQYAAESEAQDMVVTGSRVRSNDESNRAGRQVAKASPTVTMDSYGEFLGQLQAAVRSDSPRAVSRLVGFPLVVNYDGGAQTYRSRRDVERDFDRIFTPDVKEEILGQKPYSLRSRDDGRTKGSSRLWFAPACFNEGCSPPGPIRVREVTP